MNGRKAGLGPNNGCSHCGEVPSTCFASFCSEKHARAFLTSRHARRSSSGLRAARQCSCETAKSESQFPGWGKNLRESVSYCATHNLGASGKLDIEVR